MSVDYRAKLIAGWRVDADTIANLDVDVYDELEERDMLHIIDAWKDGSDYILGYTLISIDCNDCIAVDINEYGLPKEEYEELKDTWVRIFPSTPCPMLKYYMVGTCN